MNQEKLEEKGKIAFDVHSLIVENEKKRRQLLAVNAELMQKMIGEGLYRFYLGDEKAEPAAYYAEIEVYYTRNQITRLRAIHRMFKQRFGMEIVEVFDIPESRLSDIVVVANRENIEELLGLARTLPPRDWKNHIRGLKKLPTPEICDHHDYKDVAICRKCGDKVSK